MPTCPNCRKPLMIATTPTEEKMMVCVECGGRSATWGLLEKTISPISFKRLMSAYKNTRTMSSRECPDCLQPMRRVSVEIVGRGHHVEMCGKSKLAWFDHREFEHLPFLADAERELVLPDSIQDHLNEVEVQHGQVVSNRFSFRLDARDFGLGWDRDRDGRPSGWKVLLGLLLIPVERENRLSSKPWVTWALLLSAFVISYFGFQLHQILEALALSSNDLFRYGGLTFFTYFFVHGDWLHLLGNLYYLWLFGDNVEDELGPLAYIAVVAAGTAGGGLLHVLFDPSPLSVLVGASAGISTLGMVYMLRFPRAKFAIFLLFRWLRIPAYIPAIIWIVLQIDLAYDQIDGVTRVSALAHVGGALVGGIAYWLALRPSLKSI